MPEQAKYYRRGRGRDLRKADPLAKPRRRFEVDELQAITREIARRKVLGQKSGTIANALGVTREMVNYTISSPKVQDHMDALSGTRDAHVMDVKEEIRKLVPMAVRNYESILKTGSVNGKEASATLMARISGDVIDREMGKPTQVVKSANLHALFTAQDIEDIKNRGRDNGARMASAGAIDV